MVRHQRVVARPPLGRHTRPGQEILDLNVEIDVVQSEILHRYGKIDRSINMQAVEATA